MISKLTTRKNVWSKSDLPLAYQTELFENATYEELKEYTKALKREKYAFEVLNEEFDNLTPKKFLKLYQKFYTWNVTEIKDKLIKKEIKNGEHLTIKTFDVVPNYTKEGYGSDSFWMTDYYYADYQVYSKKGMLNPNYVYTKEQIADMVDQKLLIVENVETSSRYCEHPNAEEEAKALAKISLESPITKLASGFTFNRDNITKERLAEMSEQNPDVLVMIKKEFNKERLDADYQKYLKQYKEAKHVCFKKAYQMINQKEKIVQKKTEEIESLKTSLKNM